MSWASHRELTRGEDKSYSSMDIFRVNIPMLYREGAENAFTRLQQTILRRYGSHTLFLWRYCCVRDFDFVFPMFVSSPRWFCNRFSCGRCHGPQDTSMGVSLATRIDYSDLHVVPPLGRSSPFIIPRGSLLQYLDLAVQMALDIKGIPATLMTSRR